MTGSPEPSSASDSKSKQKPQPVKEKHSDTQSVSGSTPSGDANKRKRKGAPCRKDERPDLNGLYKVGSFSAKDGQDTASSSGSGSCSSQLSPMNITPHLLSRVIDEDYDEGAMDALVVLSQYHSAEPSASGAHSPTLSSSSQHTATLPMHCQSVLDFCLCILPLLMTGGSSDQHDSSGNVGSLPIFCVASSCS